MTELDQMWSQMLDHASVRAQQSGNREVAEYLRLKATNDAIRTVGVGWLFDTVIEIATERDRQNTRLLIEREDPHRFDNGSSNLVGTAIRIRQGVRCLTVEAGWTRTPGDGIMRRGALAFARVSHFGMPRSGVELMLVTSPELPFWQNSDTLIRVDSGELRRHFDILTT